MAGSKNQSKKQTSNNKGSNSKGKGRDTKKEEELQENSYAAEIRVWLICGIMLIVELGNFGLCGIINYVSKFFFGVFGVIQYVLPVAVMFAAFFLHVNDYGKRAVQKVVFGSGLLLCFGMIAQMAVGIKEYNFLELFSEGFKDQLGGGVLCGSLAYLLHTGVGTIGTYIIIILAIIVCVVLFAEFSVIDFIREMAARDPEEEDDEEEEWEEEPKRERQRRKRNSSANREIVTEDTPGDRDEIFTERRKKPSVLERIAIPAEEADIGLSASDKARKKEEVHEITMQYDSSLSGEGSKENADGGLSGEETKAKKKRAARTKKTAAADSKPQDTAADKTAGPTGTVGQAALTGQLENKTSPAVKNVDAREVGNSTGDYRFPPLELLQKSKSQAAAKEDTIRQNALKLQEVLKSFGVNVTMTNYSCGPSVTRYEMVPEQGVKVSKITGLADDIMMNLAAQSIRIEAPIPGKSAVGIEIPNGKRSGVGFRELIDTEKFIKHPSKLAFAVGKDIEGNVVVEDIAKMPHLLIAGATGSGKSVCTNTLIMSILYKARPDEVKLILVDPKQVELKVYNGIPHLLTPVVTDPKKAAGALNWAVAEMTKRYQMFSECNVRNIQGYNDRVKEVEETGKVDEEKLEKMPQIVIIVDELADLMMVAKAEVEEAIVRLAQLARAAGIHLVIATQRPSVDVVTGLIKANVPSRIALSVSSGVDSRTIIDSVGAEKLLGNGDMLFYPTMYPKPVRVQGAYISDDEVVNVVEFLKAQNGESTYSDEVTDQIAASASGSSSAAAGSGEQEDRDEYFVQAGRFIIEKDKASIGMLQRMFKIGFNRAARIMDQLFEAGVVGPEEGTKPRQVLMSEEQFEEYIDEYF